MKKKILYIKNYVHSSNLNYLKKNFDISLNRINSVALVGFNDIGLKKLIDLHDIIIIGGGPQHLIGDFASTHPEIPAQIKLVKIFDQIVKNYPEYKSKVLLGLCLGCQIIGLAFGYNIVKMNKLCLGFNYIDESTINFNHISSSQDKYLNKINWDVISKAFSNHNDCVDWNEFEYKNENENELIQNNLTNLVCVAKSKSNIPYILANSNSSIYGFQSHPEITFDCVKNIDMTKCDCNYKLEKIEMFEKISCDIHTHFFDIFINE